MQLETILNRIEKHQSFVYGKVKLIENDKRLELEIQIKPRRNSRPICSGCGQKKSGYDTLEVRRFEFVPFWGILMYFVYTMRRVDCPKCGVKVATPSTGYLEDQGPAESSIAPTTPAGPSIEHPHHYHRDSVGVLDETSFVKKGQQNCLCPAAALWRSG